MDGAAVCGALGGVSAFGAVGLFLGPVILALVIALIRFTRELREAPLPVQRVGDGDG